MKSVWIWLLMTALASLLEWLQAREAVLDAAERKKLNAAIYRARQMERAAVRLGCTEGGVPEWVT